jgi:hypothetical protein
MKITLQFLGDEIDSIPIAETDREVRTEGGVEQYRYVLRSEWRSVPTGQDASDG